MKTFFAWTLLFSLLGINCAHADFEAVETTLGKLEDVQKEAQNVQEELKKVQAAMNAVRQGEFGPLEEVKSNILNEKKVDVKLIGPIAEKVGDTKELEGAVEENIIPQYTDKDQDKAYFVNKDTTDAIPPRKPEPDVCLCADAAHQYGQDAERGRQATISRSKPRTAAKFCSRRQPGKPWKTPGALPTSGICRRRFTNCS